MTPVTVNLPDHMAGDTWEGLSIGPVLFNGAQPQYPLAACRLYIKGARSNAFAYGYKSVEEAGFGQISITNSVTWCASIPPQALPVEAGSYVRAFKTTDGGGIVRTLYKGSLTVTEDITND